MITLNPLVTRHGNVKPANLHSSNGLSLNHMLTADVWNRQYNNHIKFLWFQILVSL